MRAAKKKSGTGANKLIAEKQRESANIPELNKKCAEELRKLCSFNDLQNTASKKVSTARVCAWLEEEFGIACGKNMLNNICKHYLNRESFSRAGAQFEPTPLGELLD